MKLSAMIIFGSFTFLSFGLILAPSTHAQVGQLWETIVGDPSNQTGPVYDDEGNETGGTGPDDLDPGEFRPPFKCGLTYWGSTYKGHTHWAVDFNRTVDDYGDPIYAVADGVVYVIRATNGQVMIKHYDGGYVSVYAHLSAWNVHEGSRVSAGDKIGEIGNRCETSPGCGAHLHYNVCDQVDGCYSADTNESVEVKFFNKAHPASCYYCDIPYTNPVGPISCTW